MKSQVERDRIDHMATGSEKVREGASSTEGKDGGSEEEEEEGGGKEGRKERDD